MGREESLFLKTLFGESLIREENLLDEGLFLFKGYKLIIDPFVIPPHSGTTILAGHLPRYIRKEDKVLDLGTGSGLLGIIAAGKAKSVIATDISKASALCAKKNAVKNRVLKNFFTVVSNMFSGLRKNSFDLIVGNIPMMPTPPDASLEDPLSIAREGGRDGRYFLDRMISEAVHYLKPKAGLLFQQFDFLDKEKTLRIMEDTGFSAKIIDEKVYPLSQSGIERLDYLKSLGTDSLIHKKETPEVYPTSQL